MERPARQPQVRGVDLGDDQCGTESLTQDPRSSRVELDSDHPGAGVQQVSAQTAGPGPDVEDEITDSHPRAVNEALRPGIS